MVEGEMGFTNMYVVLNSSGNWLKTLGDNYTDSMAQITLQPSPETNNGAWRKMIDPNTSAQVDVSMCFSNTNATRIFTSMRNGTGTQEPVVICDWDNLVYSSAGVRNLLAGTYLGLKDTERGILTLERQSNWTSRAFNDTGMASIYADTDAREFRSSAAKPIEVSATFTLCTYCWHIGRHYETSDMHETYVWIFQDILKATGNIAVALQSLLTAMVQKNYYGMMPSYDVVVPATTVFYVPTLVPSTVRGLIIVASIVGAHLLTVWVLTIHYCRHRRLALLGDYWQTFAHANESQPKDIISVSSLSSDAEISSLLKRNGIAQKKLWLTFDNDKLKLQGE